MNGLSELENEIIQNVFSPFTLISDFLFRLLYLKGKFIQYVHYHTSHVNIVRDAFNITKAIGATYLIGQKVGYQSTTT